ncbi:hypothetical protein KIMH_14180 [Bombiscardovia apis]|uniref:Copper-exporting ATPase n=1 Tax=Bombiscardovia apis TaxID=2932182 RepID=A0ABN6SJ36_9BIFI|nr:hypothetical protein [Bombiscardovia apis]BDR55307.1 hypothetical protein KIMH_14180 [Bombiscardovia apis]
MGIDIFLAVGDILVAAALTWFIVWYFLLPTLRKEEPDSPDSERSASTTNKQNPITYQADSSDSAANLGSNNSEQEASPRERSTALQAQRQHSRRLTLIAAILSAPVLIVDVCARLAPDFLPTWLTSPWIQAILITPAVFYCGRPIYADSWNRLKAHQTSIGTLVTIAVALAYAYSLAACAFPSLLPEGSRQPYFDVIGVITTLALFAQTSEQSARLTIFSGRIENDGSSNAHNVNTAGSLAQLITRAVFTPSSAQRQVDMLIARAEPVVMIVAVWTFMLWLLVGPQPRLAHAVANAASVLIIACPTALALAIPLAFRAALSAGLNHGMLFTSPRAMGHLADTTSVTIDESLLKASNNADANESTCVQLARTSTHLRAMSITSIVLESSNGGDSVEQSARRAGVDFLLTGVDSERKARWVERFIYDLHQAVGMEASQKPIQENASGLVAFASYQGAEAQAQSTAQVHIDISDAAQALTSGPETITQEQTSDWGSRDLVLQTGNIDGIGQAIELARAAKRTINQNLSWGYVYNIVAIALATGLTYPLFGWMLNPIIAPVATAMATIISMLNIRRLKQHKRLRKHWNTLSLAQPEELPTLAAHRPQVIADGGHQFAVSPETQTDSATQKAENLGRPDLPDQTR